MPADFLNETCKNRSKTEKASITIKFYIFELVQVPNFSLNENFEFFDQFNSSTNSIFNLKRERWKITIEFYIFELA